jgi:hypothetical protein
MLDVGIAVLGGILYLTGQYRLALLLVVLAIISGFGAVLMAIFNPGWYQTRRSQAGLDIDMFNPRKGVGSLILTKVVIICVLCWAASYIAQTAGYY